MRRRAFLIAATLGLAPLPARATPAEAQEAIRRLVGTRPIGKGRVTVDLAPLVENGNTVPLTVTVDSPMSATDRVKAIHVFAEKNPQPLVGVFRFGPQAGLASVSTRIRLADSQTVVAIAEMSDGSIWSGSMDTVVTMSACVEGI